jgi:hypothetical protein
MTPALRLGVVVLALIACHHDEPVPPTTDGLVAYLGSLAGTDAAARREAVAGWELDRAAWDRIIAPPFRSLWDDYHARFAAEAPALVGKLSRAGAITARKHYAGDPKLTPSQARLRWALPVMAPSIVAEIDGLPIDTVFVHDGTGWRALAGLDSSIRAFVSHLDHHCGALLDAAGPPGRCSEMAAAMTDAALRTDHDQFGHMCQLATSLCGNPAP